MCSYLFYSMPRCTFAKYCTVFQQVVSLAPGCCTGSLNVEGEHDVQPCRWRRRYLREERSPWSDSVCMQPQRAPVHGGMGCPGADAAWPKGALHHKAASPSA